MMLTIMHEPRCACCFPALCLRIAAASLISASNFRPQASCSMCCTLSFEVAVSS
jgi:hypothetical protein